MIAYKYREVIKTAVQPGAAVKVSRKVKYFLKKSLLGTITLNAQLCWSLCHIRPLSRTLDMTAVNCSQHCVKGEVSGGEVWLMRGIGRIIEGSGCYWTSLSPSTRCTVLDKWWRSAVSADTFITTADPGLGWTDSLPAAWLWAARSRIQNVFELKTIYLLSDQIVSRLCLCSDVKLSVFVYMLLIL